MLIKTFNNNIDGIINKVGILNHSFGEIKNEFALNGLSGVKDLYFGSITSSDIEKIKKYNSLVIAYQKGLPNGVSSQTAWNRTMLDASSSAKRLVESNNGATVSEEDLANAIQTTTISAKASKIALQALSMVGNIISFVAINKVIELTIKGIDNLIHKSEKLKAAVNNDIDDLKSIRSNSESLNQELQTSAERISQLENKPSLTFLEQEELEKLREASIELERQIKLNETLLAV